MLKSGRRTAGFTLIEALFTIVGIALFSLLVSRSLISTKKLTEQAKDQSEAADLQASILSQFQNFNFNHVIGVDSSRTGGFASTDSFRLSGSTYYPGDYMMKWSTSPVIGVLQSIDAAVKKAGFDRWKVQVQAARRDSSDYDSDGSNVDFVTFVDSNKDYVDDYDWQVRYQDCNGDNDFNDLTCPPGVGGLPEFPDTHMKRLDVYLYKKGKEFSKLGYLMSQEKLSGKEGVSGESPLRFNIDSPWSNAYLYPKTGLGLYQNANHLTVSNIFLKYDYDSYPIAKNFKGGCFRVDSVADLSISLRAEVGSNFSLSYSTFFPDIDPNRIFYSGKMPNSGSIAVNATSDGAADRSVVDPVTGISQTLRNLFQLERRHVISGRAEQAGQYSPWGPVTIFTDKTPPRECAVGLPLCPNPSKRPGAGETIVTRTYPPFIVVTDVPGPGGVSARGLPTDIMSMATMTVTVPASIADIKYNRFQTENLDSTPKVVRMVFIDTGTLLPHMLDVGDVHMRAEFGDGCMYKASATWDFSITPVADVSTPTISNLYPAPLASVGVNPEIRFTVADSETGANPYSLEIWIQTPASLEALFFSKDMYAQPGKFISNYTTDGSFDVKYSTTTLTAHGDYYVRVKVKDHFGRDNDSTVYPAYWSFTIP